ncbi:hypothetical protein AK812_SmicGene42323 [Symbiodinium microadriaticum]|uniref:Uncharacterized protein n=1 Tax=Symbiodinium microadriaticum TaxID=2951 RepID=A0A1Q9C3V8_SYMMI|nr:hypothetical protein AK812_SmicGene42323 [Symbiodinium microadriaticum]
MLLPHRAAASQGGLQSLPTGPCSPSPAAVAVMLAIANTQANSLAQRSAATESAFQYHLKARRDVQFGPVPVAESNTGVIVVHQYIGLPPNIGQEIVRHDDYIRSQDWTKLHMPRSREEIMHQGQEQT